MDIKRTGKIIFSLILVIVFLVVCIATSGLVFTGIWLHTYNAFTDRTLVAEVTLSQQKTDEGGDYVDVIYKPVVQQSALAAIFAPNVSDPSMFNEIQSFKVYGDSVFIGGPIVKFYDHLILLNFKTVYKIGKLYGRYSIDNTLEVNRKIPASFDLNGGIDSTWQTFSDNYTKWPFNMFIQTTQISSPGMFVSKLPGNRVYDFYMTTTGFLWELK